MSNPHQYSQLRTEIQRSNGIQRGWEVPLSSASDRAPPPQVLRLPRRTGAATELLPRLPARSENPELPLLSLWLLLLLPPPPLLQQDEWTAVKGR